MYTTCAQFNEEEHIQCLQLNGFYCEEISSQDLLFGVQHQMTPTDRSTTNRSRRDVVSSQYVLDRCARYFAAQLDKFSLNLAVSSMRVLFCQVQDQAFKIVIYVCSSTLVLSWSAPPLPSYKFPMPA